MKQIKLFLFLFVLFIFEGTVMTVFSPGGIWDRVQLVPNFVMVLFLWFPFFITAVWHCAMLFFFFGLLGDIVYTSVLGVYAFCMGFTVYFIASLSKLFNMNVLVVLVAAILGVCLLQTEVYFIYHLIGVTNQTFLAFLVRHLPPTLILNAAFTILIYYPFRRFLIGMRDMIEE
ncbi:rod shape-determining protein MreD [Terrilactibacillus sp. S3-3]|nr:rod shape-determining protein MreD [Terrilactibacillus sp. S3-3]